MFENRPEKGTKGPYLHRNTTVTCTLGLFSNRKADEHTSQMSRIALHTNKLVGHRNVTISWSEDNNNNASTYNYKATKSETETFLGEYLNLSSKLQNVT